MPETAARKVGPSFESELRREGVPGKDTMKERGGIWPLELSCLRHFIRRYQTSKDDLAPASTTPGSPLNF